MTRKILFIIFIVFAIQAIGECNIQTMHNAVLARKNVVSGATDYSTGAYGCKGYWRMNDTGTENDDSTAGGNDNLAEHGGTIDRVTTVPSGFSGYSRDFEAGDTESLTAAEGGSTDISGANQPFTMFIRVKVENDVGDMMLMNKGLGNGTKQYRWQIDANNYAQGFLFADGSATTTNTGTTDVVTGTSWVSIAWVYDDTDMRLYVDGVLDSNGADNPKTYSGGIFDGANAFFLGKYGDASKYLDGLVYEGGIWDTALTAANILEMHNNGIGGDKGASD